MSKQHNRLVKEHTENTAAKYSYRTAVIILITEIVKLFNEHFSELVNMAFNYLIRTLSPRERTKMDCKV
jgi:hypothetical protein